MNRGELERWFQEHEILEDDVWEEFLGMLEAGLIRAASQNADGAWSAIPWVKQAILRGFRKGGSIEFGWPGPPLSPTENPSAPASLPSGFFDRPAFPPRLLTRENNVRMVPGGSSVRRGAYVAPGVVIMPPAYINVGAWVGAGTMVDSHALVGSCAQIGENVHLSAGAQIGGVLEPPQGRPVIIEDGAFVGGLCGVFEGIVVGRNAVLAPGVIVSRSTKIFDLVNEREFMGEIPPNAVVVPGARPANGSWASEHGLSLQAPCIVKYRDEGTAASVALESALR